MIRYIKILLVLSIATVKAQISGCTDPLSLNYNPQATINDGSCTYTQALVVPVATIQLPEIIKETSGLIQINDKFYTHNDSNDTNLYEIDTTNGEILNTILLPGVTNIDWEDITQDNEYIYIGDFGNNNNGNRADLKIYKISKTAFTLGNPIVETISFSYSNQTDFSPAGGNSTDFDCEALVVNDTGIYLFTKQWISNNTSVYFVPKTPGNYTAVLQDSYNVNGLVTGAAYIADKKLIVLSGYSSTVQPFLYLLYDFTDNNFFNGNKRKIIFDRPFHQTEAIATTNGLQYYVTNEKLNQLGIQPKLFTIDLSQYLQPYFDSLLLPVKKNDNKEIVIYPNPVTDKLTIITPERYTQRLYQIYDAAGRIVQQDTIDTLGSINVISLQQGIYYLKSGNNNQAYKFIKK